MASNSSKTLSPERTAAARVYLRQVVDEDFGGNITRAAAGLGLSGAYVSEALSGKVGIGAKLLEALADHRNVAVDTVLGRVLEERAKPSGRSMSERMGVAVCDVIGTSRTSAVVRMAREAAGAGVDGVPVSVLAERVRVINHMDVFRKGEARRLLAMTPDGQRVWLPWRMFAAIIARRAAMGLDGLEDDVAVLLEGEE